MGATLILSVGLFSGGVWQIVGQASAFGIIIYLILVSFSLVSWSIMFNKWRVFKRVEEQTGVFLNFFRKSHRLSDIVGQAKALHYTPLAGVFFAGYDEIRGLLDRKQDPAPNQETARRLTDRDIEVLSMTLERSTSEEIGRLERYVIFLATTANASPFLGLLGTVVGVMESFWSIGERGSASLVVVAPGLAEALLATIVGLAAAIPAVIGYNWATNKLKRQFDRTSNFSLEFLARVKKDLT
ncbi:MAG: MotA/TolQ/ExbB proton channel family protein [Candidatus Zixiibacteriota bacterium]|nr:MAG: MotA/TolQ/ExbB proton channel family protein [candidate division Zixibacteria bacterium]